MTAQSHPGSLKRFFSSANLTLILVIIFVFCLISLVRQTSKYFSIKKEINGLEKEIQTLEEKNSQISSSLDLSNSDFYRERQARLMFGLQKPDEKVAIIVLDANNQEVAPENTSLPQKQINPIKWWQYFFK